MNNDHLKDSIQQTVLDTIRAGKVRRLPHWRFVLRFIAVIVVSALSFISSVFTISFILFSLHESGEQFLLGFGIHGIQAFLQLFPWLLLLLTVVLLTVFEWLLRGFAFGYRIPLLYIFLGIVGVSIVLGVAISVTPLHTSLLERANNNQLPVVGEAYVHILTHHDDQGVYRGTVVSAEKDTFSIRHSDRDGDEDDGTFIVRRIPGSTMSIPSVGEKVLILGKQAPGYIQAEDIQVFPRR